MSEPMNQFLRLGAVSYLNSRPLVEKLRDCVPQAEISLDFPSRLANRLRERQLDAALIPSIEFFRIPDLRISSDACVAARGEVLSVRLFCRTSPGQVQRLALDDGSRTSATLARIILAEHFGAFPKTEQLSLAHGLQDSTADAVLLIGDRAMHEPVGDFNCVIDLGEFWYEWTGLPFVFAIWAVHEDCATESLAMSLSRARDEGVKLSKKIAAEQAPLIGISESTAFQYLTKNLHYRLSSAERSGLRLFHELALSHNLVKTHAELNFGDLVTA